MSQFIRGDQDHRGQTFQFQSIEEQGRRLLEAARLKAQQIIDEARAEADGVRDVNVEEGRAEGRQKGLAEGREQGRQEARTQAIGGYQQQFSQLQQILVALGKDLENGRRELLDRSRHDLVELAVAAARKIVGVTVEIDRRVVQDNLARAVDLILEKARLRVRVHPDDRAHLEEVVPGLIQEYTTLEAIDLIDDPSIGPGGVVVEGAAGRVDAAIESQLARLEDELLGRRDTVRCQLPTSSPAP